MLCAVLAPAPVEAVQEMKEQVQRFEGINPTSKFCWTLNCSASLRASVRYRTGHPRRIFLAATGQLQVKWTTKNDVDHYEIGETGPQSMRLMLAEMGVSVELESKDAEMLYEALRSCCERHPHGKAQLRVVRGHSFQARTEFIGGHGGCRTACLSRKRIEYRR